MFRVEANINHVAAGRHNVVALYESINQPLVNLPNVGTAPTAAYILGARDDQGRHTVYVYLTQKETRGVLIYVADPQYLSVEQYQVEEVEGVRFTESMGFLVDNLGFSQLSAAEQDAVMARIPMFRPVSQTVDLYEVASELPRSSGSDAPNPLFGGMGVREEDLFRRVQGGAMDSIGNLQPLPGAPASAPSWPPAPLPLPPPVPAEPAESDNRSAGSSEEKRQALERLGRLLVTFVFALAFVFAGLPGCTKSSHPVVTPGAQSQLDLGHQQLSDHRWADAIRSFERVLTESEDNRDALRGLGLAYLNLNRLVDAEKWYRLAVEANPKWSVAKNELAVVLISTNQCSEAEGFLREATKDIFYQTSEFAEHNLARALSCQGKNAEALERLENLTVRRPYFCLAYLTLAQLSSAQKKHETTISACQGFAKNCEQHEVIGRQVLPQQSAMCYLKQGLAYAQIGDLDSARASFRRCQSDGRLGEECRRSLRLLPP